MHRSRSMESPVGQRLFDRIDGVAPLLPEQAHHFRKENLTPSFCLPTSARDARPLAGMGSAGLPWARSCKPFRSCRNTPASSLATSPKLES